MDALMAVTFVFLAGLTLAGLSGALIELAWGERLALRHPFVSPHNVSRSLVLVLLAGPLMTLNEAIAAMNERRIGITWFVAVIGFCAVWIAATGMLVVGILQDLATG